MYDAWGWRPYVSAAERRLQALREVDKRRKKGHVVSPVRVEGRTIVKTFWGKSWCDNLERYSDFANRLPRGRTYVRNGSVIDLQISPGEIKALVSGSEIYEVAVKVAPVTKARWRSICKDCAGAIDSLIELLQGRLSTGVMERICLRNTGLFPSPKEIKLSCSCPDWAEMCKHVAAVLYGIGARLDQQPELLFRLHGVDEKELIAHADVAFPLVQEGTGGKGPRRGRPFRTFWIGYGCEPSRQNRAFGPRAGQGKARKEKEPKQENNGSAMMSTFVNEGWELVWAVCRFFV